MTELYKEYFYIPEDGKIRDKVIVVRMIITVTVMLACLAAMTYSAYAYFSHSITSGSNIIKSADYSLTVTMPDGILPEAGGYYHLSNGVTYTVKLEKQGTAKTGFCVIEVTAGARTTRYHTQQIGLANGAETLTLSFTIDTTAIPTGEKVKVKFIPHWGTSSHYNDENYKGTNGELYIEAGETVKITLPAPSLKVPMHTSPETLFVPETTSEPTETTTEPTETTSPVETDAVTTDAVTTDAVTEPETEAATTAAEIVYTVKEGDKLWMIADKHGVALASLVAYNNIANPDRIIPGQKLRIPPAGWTVPTETTSAPDANA